MKIISLILLETIVAIMCISIMPSISCDILDDVDKSKVIIDNECLDTSTNTQVDLEENTADLVQLCMFLIYY